MNNRILVIDDNRAIHEDFRKILCTSKGAAKLGDLESALFEEDESGVRQGGFELDSADQGQAGWELVKKAVQEERPFAVAFVDMRMPPGWDGVETIEHIWQTDPDVQIVICTAYSDHSWEDVIRRLANMEKLLILRKPFDNIEVQQLAAALSQKWNLAKEARELLNDLEQRVRLRTAQLWEKNEELVRSNQELQQFAQIASHDLQEPLRKIQTFGDRLRTKCADGLDDVGKDYLSRMQGAAERMQTLIQDLLSYARVTSKGQPFGPIDLQEIAEGVLSDLEMRLETTGGRVDVGKLPRIEGDGLQMRQLFQNLIGNALKYHKPEVPPIVSVSAQPIEGPDSGGDPCWKIVVQDNGIGFEEEYEERIFAMFQRLHGRGEYEGTGVGLSICRKIVERHGGTITAKGIPGEGSTFTITFPVRQVQEALAGVG
jgi:two-component system NtrC family sensor kinase